MSAARRTRMLEFRSGGWVLILATVITLAGFGWRLAPLFLSERPRPVGDGVDPDSYGFSMEPSLIPRDRIVAGGLAKDGLRALVDPPTLTPAQVREWNAEHRGKYLVPSDRVIGVALGEEQRAYPLRVLNWHEVANDTIGGRPVAVSYNALCDAVAVFSREVEGEILEFGVSGLLYNSNLLMFDRRPGARGESLWSQLQARAVAGPAAAAGRMLRTLPFSLTTWEDWTTRHPGTTVLAPDPSETERYARDVYGTYFNAGRLRFPVEPLPPEGTFPHMTAVLVAGGPGERRVYRFEEAPRDLRRGETDSPLVHAFWFAWYAAHPNDPGRMITRPGPESGT